MNIGPMKIQPGNKTRGFIEMPDFAGPLQVRFPVLAACGRIESPVVTFTAAQHGREVQGVEAIRRVFEALDPDAMRGCVIAIPVANPLAIRMCQQDYPTELDRPTAYNLNRHWPGKVNGTLHERMCHTLWENVIRHSSFHIDLHGWTGNSMGLAWSTAVNRNALNAFSYPISMVYSSQETQHNCMLDEACEQAGIPWLTAELTPQNRLWEKSVLHGVRGLTNVLKYLGVLDGPLDLEPRRYFITPESVEHKSVAEDEGIVSADFPLGTMLSKGQRFGAIYSLDTLQPVQELISPADGLLFNIGSANPSSVVAPGMTVALVKEIAEIL